jgi:hypothetical protein
MRARTLMVAAVVLIVATSVAAEPAKPEAREAKPPVSRPAPVILASADQVQPPAPATPQAQPTVKRPRLGRVTTCRCADQVPQ